VRISRWFQNSVAIERGPLVYALHVEGKSRRVHTKEKYGDYLEILPRSPWNYGLLESAVNNPAKGFELTRREVTAIPGQQTTRRSSCARKANGFPNGKFTIIAPVRSRIAVPICTWKKSRPKRFGCCPTAALGFASPSFQS
jgi:hypothetical protein